MKRLLIVTPHFPPANAADMHRVRQSLPYYRQFGWDPTVLTVDPDRIDGYRDDTLERTIPRDVEVLRVGALDSSWTRHMGVRTIGLRALASLARAGDRFLGNRNADLVLISTTAFPLMVLGQRWKRRYGVPYVLDMQDPWYTGIEPRPGQYPPLSKAWLARRLHGLLEPRALRAADGIIAVSPAYVPALRARYPNLRDDCCAVIPFGVSAHDYELAGGSASASQATRRVGLYIGAANPEMWPVIELLFRAVCRGREQRMPGFANLTFQFAGTNYAPRDRVRPVVAPLADRCGLGDSVTEDPPRLPYIETLRRLQAADFLLVFGSTAPSYVPSKLYPYAMAGRPVFALCHDSSPLVAAYRELYGRPPATFTALSLPADDGTVREVASRLSVFLSADPVTLKPDPERLATVSAEALTRAQCALFDRVLAARSPVETVPERTASAHHG